MMDSSTLVVAGRIRLPAFHGPKGPARPYELVEKALEATAPSRSRLGNLLQTRVTPSEPRAQASGFWRFSTSSYQIA